MYAPGTAPTTAVFRLILAALSSGWVPIITAWAYIIGFWLLADGVKTIVLYIFKTAEEQRAAAQEAGVEPPMLIRILDAPSSFAEASMDKVQTSSKVIATHASLGLHAAAMLSLKLCCRRCGVPVSVA